MVVNFNVIKNCQTRMFVKCTTHVMWYILTYSNHLCVYMHKHIYPHTHIRRHVHMHTRNKHRLAIGICDTYRYGNLSIWWLNIVLWCGVSWVLKWLYICMFQKIAAHDLVLCWQQCVYFLNNNNCMLFWFAGTWWLADAYFWQWWTPGTWIGILKRDALHGCCLYWMVYIFLMCIFKCMLCPNAAPGFF